MSQLADFAIESPKDAFQAFFHQYPNGYFILDVIFYKVWQNLNVLKLEAYFFKPLHTKHQKDKFYLRYALFTQVKTQYLEQFFKLACLIIF